MRYRQYQIEDIVFLSNLMAAACFNEQRTGKTPTALGVCRVKKAHKILIVCPASLLYDWKRQFETWLNRPCVVIDGTPTQKKKQFEHWADGLVISYDTLKKTCAREGFLNEILRNKPDLIIADEIHRIRNRNTAVAKALFYLAYRIPNKLVLTGTPVIGKPEDLWSILHFLFPHTYTSFWRWIDEFCNTHKIYTPSGSEVSVIDGIKKEKEKELTETLKTFSTMRKRAEIMQWLPDKDYLPILLPLNPFQKRYLEELTEWFEIAESNIVTFGVLDRLMRYRQICLAPELLGLKAPSPKIDWILQYIKDYDKPCIIFSNFTEFLKILKEKIPTGQMIIGATPLKTRAEICKQFQNKEFKTLLINIQAGKEGLTLDTAECIIFTDKYPPIGVIEQAEDRFVSTTIDKANKPHLIIDLIMRDSYEVEIDKMLRQRRSEADIINNYIKYIKEAT